MAEGKKKGMPTWAVVLIVVVVGGPFVLGIVSALAIYGLRKYMQNAKGAEATAALQAWSKGMVACGEREGHLPPSSAAVPASLASIAAMKYQSAPTEWTDAAFACTGFSMSGPQYFQYQWLQESDSRGVLHALADLDGDGRAEESFAVSVSCTGGHCTASGPAPAGP
jgi:type IV pilus assembly protein PilA